MEDIDAVEARRALPEGLLPVVNFYTYGTVRNANNLDEDGTHSLGKILIDGGFVMNIMPFYLAKKLKLNLAPTMGLAICTATAHVTRIDWQCSLDITIAGVTATATVYCIPEPSRPSYTLLLGRRWLAQCKAVGHYETDTYIIRDSNDNSFLVPVHGTPSKSVESPEIVGYCHGLSLDDDKAPAATMPAATPATTPAATPIAKLPRVAMASMTCHSRRIAYRIPTR